MVLLRIISIFLLLLFISCTSTQNESVNPAAVREIVRNDSLHVIDVDQLDEEFRMPLSTIFKGVKTIILDSNQEALMGGISKVQVCGDSVYILDATVAKSLFVFDKQGHFVRKIGRVGQGPGEYIVPYDFTIDYKNRVLYLLDEKMQKILEYALSTGEFIGSTKIKDDTYRSFHIQFNDGKMYADAFTYLQSNDNFLLRELNMDTGEQKECWLKVSQYNKGWNELYFTGNGFFFSRNRENPKFVEMFMDTVMSIHHGKISPFLVLKSKDLLTKKELELSRNEEFNNRIKQVYQLNKIYNITNFIECQHMICFESSKQLSTFLVFYNTKTKSVKLGKYAADDLVYLKDEMNSLRPNFCYADSKGIYSYVHPMSMSRFSELAKNNKLAPGLDKRNELIKLTENSNPILFYYEYEE